MKKFILVLISILMMYPISSYALPDEQSNTQIVTLEACVDGDTAKFKTAENEIIKARFLAIDTPETVHPTKGEEPFGKAASNYTCTSLTNALEIKIEYDENSTLEDKYGRKLVWVFVDGVLLQDSLISQGYAEVAYLYGDYKYTSLLQDSEALAKVNKVGIWSIDEIEEETIEKVTTEKKKSKETNFFNKLINDLLAMIFDFLDELLEKILKTIEDML